MAYTALQKMRDANERRFGKDVGPLQPALSDGALTGFDLKSAALRFIHEGCEGLRHDARIAEEEERTGVLRGTSLGPSQIPYNMQMDIDRACLERTVERFVDSGSTQDAYDVYYCFAEMFLGGYSSSKGFIELLSEWENNASRLLAEHRDHYSHSVYVFVLGLAIYETNANFRRTFDAFYGFDTSTDAAGRSHEAACFFLEFWGLTSLFHDIGYPFELVFEQVMSFFGVQDDRGEGTPYIVYQNTRTMTELTPDAQKRFEHLYGRRFATVNELLAYDVTQKLGSAYGFAEDYLAELLEKKPTSPEDFAYYMDHGYFSAICLYHELEGSLGGAEGTGCPMTLQAGHVDALSAILLHYVVFRYSLAPCSGRDKPSLPMELHPLAWLLILCDELQCWDRIAYGRNTKTELHPMGAEFDFRDNRIVARYLFDEAEQDKIDAYHSAYLAWKKAGEQGKAPKLKAYSSFAGKRHGFVDDIEYLVDLSGTPLAAASVTAPANRKGKRSYLSDSSFLHAYDFAVALNARYAHEGHEDGVGAAQLGAEFEALSLEYKLDNIDQVKNLARFLDAIHCFYTDRPVDYDMLTEFTPEQIEVIAPMEHERWLREHRAAGWRYGDDYERVPVPDGVAEKPYRKMLREQMRCHKLMLDGELTQERMREHYQSLSESEKGKDWQPFSSLLTLLERFDGLRLYKL